MNEPKVLVCSPVSEQHKFATERFLERIENLSYQNYDLLIIDNSKTEDHYKSMKVKKAKLVRDFYEFKKVREKLVACRNYMRKTFLENNYEYMICVDQDVIPPKNLIEKLTATQKDIVTGIYYNYFEKTDGSFMKLPVIWGFFDENDIKLARKNIEKIKEINKEMYELIKNNNDSYLIEFLRKPISFEQANSGKLIEIKICGTGCILISRKVLQEIEFRYDNNTDAFDDTFFCEDARKKGCKIYADTTVQCEHLIRERPWKWQDFKDKGEM